MVEVTFWRPWSQKVPATMVKVSFATMVKMRLATMGAKIFFQYKVFKNLDLLTSLVFETTFATMV